MKKIIISRTDNIGDVVLTLPLAGIVKKRFPEIHICFLGKSYTKPLLESCRHIDSILEWDRLSQLPAQERIHEISRLKADAIIHVYQDPEIIKLAFKAKIPLRIATTHRLTPWFYCNSRVFFSRRRSTLHEAQLNFKLLRPLGIREVISLNEIPLYYGLTISKNEEQEKFKLILHPKSKGSAREWGLENFSRLINLLSPEKYEIFITGTQTEGQLMSSFLAQHRNRVTDMTGKIDLHGFIRFIAGCDGLIAASTGPLHLAAALGKIAVGLYAPMRPIYPKRWAPLGKFSGYLVNDKQCSDCRKTFDCHCLRSIPAESVLEMLMDFEKKVILSREL